MTFAIHVNHIDGSIAEYANFRLYGLRVAGGYQLNLILEGALKPKRSDNPPVTIESIDGDIWTQYGGKQLLIGHLHSEAGLPIQQMPHVNAHQLIFRVDTQASALEHIEQVRSNGDLQLRLTVRGIARYWRKDSNDYQTPADTKSFTGSWTVCSVTCHHYDWKVPQSEWVRILKEMGYAARVLIEVGLPIGSGSPDLSAASGHLSIAQEALLGRRWKDSVAECRLAIERLQAHIGQAPKPVNPQDHKQFSKEQRWLWIVESIHRVAHLAHHADPISASTNFTREDATGMVAAVAAVLQLYTT